MASKQQMVKLYGGATVGNGFALLEVTVPVAQCKVLASGSKREVSEAMRRKVIGYGKGTPHNARAVIIPI